MKKTISVNIKGINFIMEEEAYERLEQYIERLKQSLTGHEGADEILEDVELRIAELCDAKLNDNKDVVELEDIIAILETLGDPSEYVDEDEESNYTEYAHVKTDDKRLFRDEENAQIAGVCAGLASYFGIDVVVVRLLWVLFFFLGFGVLMYIILWIVIPKASSSIDRLRMKGKPITVESVRDEVNRAADNISKGSKRIVNTIKTDKAPKGISTLGRILSIGLGLFFGAIGLSYLVGFLVFILGGFKFIPVVSDEGFLSLSQLGELLLPTSGDVTLAWVGGLLGSISIISFLLFLSFTLLFRVKNKWSKYVFISLFATALIGGGIALYLGMKTGRDFVIQSKGKSTNKITYSGDTLSIKPLFNKAFNTDEIQFQNDHEFPLITILEDRMYFSNIRVEYKNSSDSLFHIYTEKRAQGHTLTDARSRVEHIEYDLHLENNTLYAGTEYSVPREDKIRVQEVEIIIEIPEGKSVQIEGETIRLGETESQEEEHREIHYQRGRLKRDGEYRHYNRW